MRAVMGEREIENEKRETRNGAEAPFPDRALLLARVKQASLFLRAGQVFAFFVSLCIDGTHAKQTDHNTYSND